MKTTTHEFAELLKKWSETLRKGPNIDASDAMELLGSQGHFSYPEKNKKKSSKDDLPIALSALLSLSTVDKKEWVALINELGLDIEIRPRDASRDILGKVLKILESEPQARESLKAKVKSRDAKASPELAQALSSLLGS